MNYVLQINDLGGYICYYAPRGGHTYLISEAYVTTSRREAMRIRRVKRQRFDVSVKEVTDKELFEARLKGT